MAVRRRTRQMIFDSMKSYLQNVSSSRLTDYNTGSVLNSLLDVVAAELENVYNENYQTYQANYITTATGDDLDNKASDYDLTRNEATYSSGHLLFGRLTAHNIDIVIPVGTIATTATTSATNAVQFETNEFAVLSAGSLTVRVASRARNSGADGNGTVASIVVLPSPPSGIEYVTNATAFSGGADTESDTDLRTRISANLDQLQRGTKSALEAAAQTVDGVFDAYVEENTPTYGFGYCWVADSTGTASTQLLTDVQVVLDQYEPLGTQVIASAPLVHPLNIVTWVQLKSGFSFSTVQASIESLIKEWFDAKRIGEDIYRSELIDIIQSANGVKTVNTSTETLIESESAACSTTLIEDEAQTTSSKYDATTDYNCYSVQGVYLTSDTAKTGTNYISSWDRNKLTLADVPIENEIQTPISTLIVPTTYEISSVVGIYTDTTKTGVNYYAPSGSSSGQLVTLGTSLPATLPTVYVTYVEAGNGANTNTSLDVDYTYQKVEVANEIAEVKGVYADSDPDKATDHYFGGSFSSSTIYLGDAFSRAGQSAVIDYWTETGSKGLIPYTDISIAVSSTARTNTITIQNDS